MKSVPCEMSELGSCEGNGLAEVPDDWPKENEAYCQACTKANDTTPTKANRTRPRTKEEPRTLAEAFPVTPPRDVETLRAEYMSVAKRPVLTVDEVAHIARREAARYIRDRRNMILSSFGMRLLQGRASFAHHETTGLVCSIDGADVASVLHSFLREGDHVEVLLHITTREDIDREPLQESPLAPA